MKNTFIVCTFLLFFCNSYGQEISGLVTDVSGAPLPGVTIVVGGTNKGTTTDFDGNYTIAASTGNVLRFSYLGMKTQSVTVGLANVINVTMEEDSEQLSEVIVTAFGISQEKKALGYSAQSVDAEAITRTKQTNLVSALQGQVAGVQITNSGGAPGQSARLIIRGINSLDPQADNQPLFVVDGVPIDNSTVESGGTPRGLTNRAADINPADVESMSILKGAAATALYGVRAANGAVIITTKKGKAGQVSVSFNSSLGFEELNRLPKLQDQYGQGFSGEYNPDSFWPSWGAPISEVAKTEPGHKYQDNWNRAFDTGVQTDNSLSISGGGEKATFYGSFGNFEQKGIIPFSDWGRTTAKLSGSVAMSEKFNFSGSVNYSNSGGNRVPHDRYMERMMYWAETQDVRDYINPDGTMKTYGNTNPIYDARFSTYKDNVNRLIGNLNLNYSPTDWLSLSYRV
ncbi:MAG: SusC/RagA family TonB-linked outer membrane protein, partial [Arenibacter sp.]|nr:SusC/RagA family TonB-linked outer membrane protein [Arenibacter sp.]